jgi:hypothetical protein
MLGDQHEKVWGQLWGTDREKDEDWDMVEHGVHSAAFASVRSRDPLVSSLIAKTETGGIAAALALVSHVNARRERLAMDDLGELAALITQCALTSDALLHSTTVRVLEKLTAAGLPVIGLVLKIGETALGADTENLNIDTDAQMPSASPAVRDPRDARAVSRLLMLLTHFGQRGGAARTALVEHRAETLCLSVLAAHGPSALPAAAATQAIRVLGLMFCHSSGPARSGMQHPPADTPSAGAASSLSRPSVPKCRMVTKALTLLLNRPAEEGSSVGPAAMGASLDLLLRLSRESSMCLNLLFSVTEECDIEEAPLDQPIAVSVSCAFRLYQCSARLAQELTNADERWEASEPGSDGESEAAEVLQAWLDVGELLLNLCQTILSFCPTVSVFLAVMSPSGTPPENVDQEALQAVLKDVGTALGKLCQGKSRLQMPCRPAVLVGHYRALTRELVEQSTGPPPTTLKREVLCPAASSSTGSGEASNEQKTSSEQAAESEPNCDEVLAEVVSLFAGLAELEASPEWKDVSELDSTENLAEGSGVSWEFDAVAQRNKRQALRDQAEADRKTKRLKQAQSQQAQSQQRSTNDREREERERKEKEKASAKRDPERDPPVSTAIVPADPKAAGQEPAAAPKAADGSAQALAQFLKDHPHFMRVLQNPKKTLGDPRVKQMFVKEVSAYPLVKSFLEQKGVKLD